MKKIYLIGGIILVLVLSLYFFGVFRDNFYTSEKISEVGGMTVYSSNYFEDSYIIGVETLYKESLIEGFSVEVEPNLLKGTKYDNCILKGYGFGTCNDFKEYTEKSFVVVRFVQFKQESGDISKILELTEELFSNN